MNATQLKIGSLALGFILVFSLGYWMNRSGKPYSILLLTIHKLVSLGIIVYLVLQVIQSGKLAPLTPTLWIAGILTSLLFLGTLATGGLLSVDKEMPVFIHILHQVTPYLTLVSTSVILYLLFIRSAPL